MPLNDEMIAIRLPSSIKEGLERKFPEVKDRNNLIRALLQKYLHGEVKVSSYEIEINNT